MIATLEGIEKLDWTLWQHPFFYVAVFLFAACVGSYLNVVIYRIPLGMSTREPKRSFCPHCKKTIPLMRNIPIVTWLVQKGRCAECDEPIAVRYLLVEILTGALWVACWWFFVDYKWQEDFPPSFWYPAALALFAMIITTLFIIISFTDIEHLVIPLPLTIGGSVVALIAAGFLPQWWGQELWYEGLKMSLFGGILGFAGLWFVVLLGKFLFGKKLIKLEEPLPWKVIDSEENSDDPNDNIKFVLEDEENYWHDLFYRKSDVLRLEGVSDFELNGEFHEYDEVQITEDAVYFNEDSVPLEEVKSISGKVKSLLIPREAMGMGDVHLLGVIGLCLGAKSLFFVVLTASLIGILIHLSARAGLGKQMPFGPSLILGAALWVICGPEFIDIYMKWVKETFVH